MMLLNPNAPQQLSGTPAWSLHQFPSAKTPAVRLPTVTVLCTVATGSGTLADCTVPQLASLGDQPTSATLQPVPASAPPQEGLHHFSAGSPQPSSFCHSLTASLQEDGLQGEPVSFCHISQEHMVAQRQVNMAAAFETAALGVQCNAASDTPSHMQSLTAGTMYAPGTVSACVEPECHTALQLSVKSTSLLGVFASAWPTEVYTSQTETRISPVTPAWTGWASASVAAAAEHGRQSFDGTAETAATSPLPVTAAEPSLLHNTAAMEPQAGPSSTQAINTMALSHQQTGHGKFRSAVNLPQPFIGGSIGSAPDTSTAASPSLPTSWGRTRSTSCVITGQIQAACSMSELADVIHQHLAQFDVYNYTAGFVKLAKLRASAGHQLKKHNGITTSCAKQPHGLSSVLSMPRFPVAQVTPQHAADQDPHTSAGGTTAHHTQLLCKLLLAYFSPQKLLEDANPRALSHLVWAFAKLEINNSSKFELKHHQKLLAAVRRHMKDASVVGTSVLSEQQPAANHNQPNNASSSSNNLAHGTGGLRKPTTFSPRDLSTIAYGAAKMSHKEPAFWASLDLLVCESLASGAWEACSTQDWSNLLYAYGKRGRCTAGIPSKAAAGMAQRHPMNAQAMSNAVWACAQLRHYDATLCQRAWEHVLSQPSDWAGQALSNLLYSCKTLGYDITEPVLQLLDTCPTIFLDKASQQGLVNSLWALSAYPKLLQLAQSRMMLRKLAVAAQHSFIGNGSIQPISCSSVSDNKSWFVTATATYDSTSVAAGTIRKGGRSSWDSKNHSMLYYESGSTSSDPFASSSMNHPPAQLRADKSCSTASSDKCLITGNNKVYPSTAELSYRTVKCEESNGAAAVADGAAPSRHSSSNSRYSTHRAADSSRRSFLPVAELRQLAQAVLVCKLHGLHIPLHASVYQALKHGALTQDEAWELYAPKLALPLLQAIQQLAPQAGPVFTSCSQQQQNSRRTAGKRQLTAHGQNTTSTTTAQGSSSCSSASNAPTTTVTATQHTTSPPWATDLPVTRLAYQSSLECSKTTTPVCTAVSLTKSPCCMTATARTLPAILQSVEELRLLRTKDLVGAPHFSFAHSASRSRQTYCRKHTQPPSIVAITQAKRGYWLYKGTVRADLLITLSSGQRVAVVAEVEQNQYATNDPRHRLGVSTHRDTLLKAALGRGSRVVSFDVKDQTYFASLQDDAQRRQFLLAKLGLL